MFCLLCSEEIGDINKTPVCPFCGTNQFGQNGKYLPTKADIAKEKKLIKKMEKGVCKQSDNEKPFLLTDEEILALGLYPEDENYKMSLISRILAKHL